MPKDLDDIIVEKLLPGNRDGGSARMRTADGKTFTMPGDARPAKPQDFSKPSPQRSEEVAGQVQRLSALGLGKTAVANCVRVSVEQLNRNYSEEFELGRKSMSEVVASAAMEQVKAGNPQMIMYMAKTRLGWTEHNVVEHTGTVNAVVSAKPLTREEFEQRYLSDDGAGRGGLLGSVSIGSGSIKDRDDD